MKIKEMKIIILMFIFLVIPALVSGQEYTFDTYFNPEKYKTEMIRVKEIEVTAGMSYSFLDCRFHPIFTKPYAVYKDFTIAYGYNDQDMLVGTATYEVMTLKETFKITIPVLDMVRLDVGLYGGWKRLQAFDGTSGNNEWDFGACGTLIKKTF